MEADFHRQGNQKMDSRSGLEPLKEFHLTPGQNTSREPRQILLSPEETDNMNFKILTDMEESRTPFILPRDQPIELLFFRRIFTRLRKQKAMAIESEASAPAGSGRCSISELPDEADESIPIQAFQRAMGRLFYVLRDPEGFDSKRYDTNGNNIVGWGEFCYVWKDRQITVRLSMYERIFLTLDDPQSSILARIVSIITLFTIVVSSLGFILSTVQEFQDKPEDGSAPKPGPVFEYIEQGCLIIFVIEYLARLCTCWAIRDELFDKTVLLELAIGYERIELSYPLQRLWRFVKNLQNLIDLAAILPGVMTWFEYLFTGKVSGESGGFVVLRLVRLTRIFRAFRLGKYVEPVLVIGRTVKQSTKALYVLAFNLLLGVVIFGSLMYLMEQGDWDPATHEYLRVVDYQWNATLGDYEKILGVTPFKSIPHAFWWALVTSTTVGYGDHYPTTSNGYIVAVVCMVWSLVILALPVGVIGGTFLQVWEEFAKNKKKDRDELRQEMVYVAHAIQRIEPSRVSRLFLLEVWNDSGDGEHNAMPASPEDFMGEVKLELELPMDQQVRGKELRLRLQPNLTIVKREISGFINVRYDWKPNSTGSPGTVEAEDGSSHALQKLLDGTLTFEIISARDLIKTDWGSSCGQSSPYVVALCYPSSPAAEGSLDPSVWRCPTVTNTLDPVWQSSLSIRYLWQVPVDSDEDRYAACSKVSESHHLGPRRDRVLKFCEPDQGLAQRSESTGSSVKLEQSSLTVQPFSLDSLNQEEVISKLLQLTSTMPKLADSLCQIQEQVTSLSARVDQCSAQLQARSSGTKSGGTEGPGRPDSRSLPDHSLRTAARSDPQWNVGGFAPAHPAAGQKMTFERSDLNGTGIPCSPTSEGMDAIEDVGVVFNRGPRDMVADASSLPHAIPHAETRAAW